MIDHIRKEIPQSNTSNEGYKVKVPSKGRMKLCRHFHINYVVLIYLIALKSSKILIHLKFEDCYLLLVLLAKKEGISI